MTKARKNAKPASPTATRKRKTTPDNGGIAQLIVTAAGEGAEPTDAGAQFLAELANHWQRYGKAAFDAALSKDPVRYLGLAAKLIGKEGARDAEGGDLVALLAALETKTERAE